MITTANITMQFGAKPLFENISAKFGNGNKYGLIGANGCGKSTFMKILSGDLAPSAGNISYTPGERIGKLSQNQFAYEEFAVVDAVQMGDPRFWEVRQERDRIYSLPEMSEEDGMKVADLESEFAEMDGYTAETRAIELLVEAGISEEYYYGPMSEVAPGLKLRVLIAQALFCNPDMLLLDEPTNNLDIYTIKWLEDVLNKRDCTMIIISHDRHFLNEVCTHMADIDRGELRIYPGNYDDFMTASAVALDKIQNENAKKKAEIKELQGFVARFSANASKAKQATSRAKRLDKIELEEVVPSSRQSPYITYKQHKKLHRLALELNELQHGFDGETLFTSGDILLEAGTKLAVIGENGAGKTTLLRCLVNEIEADSGIIKWAESASIGYIGQDVSSDFAKSMSLFDWMSQWRQPYHDDLAVRAILGRLLFSSDEIKKDVKVCSGGEKNRLMFGKLMMQEINVIIMDEPTNHMDMEAIEALNQALVDFDGTLIFVSHDREFVSSIATSIIEIKDKKLNYFQGAYDEFLTKS